MMVPDTSFWIKASIRAAARKGYLILSIGAFLKSSSATVQAQPDLEPIIEEIRETALKEAGPDRLGAGYAAMINFVVNPEVSTATFHVE